VAAIAIGGLNLITVKTIGVVHDAGCRRGAARSRRGKMT